MYWKVGKNSVHVTVNKDKTSAPLISVRFSGVEYSEILKDRLEGASIKTIARVFDGRHFLVALQRIPGNMIMCQLHVDGTFMCEKTI